MGLQVPVSFPSGSILPFAGAVAPDGWLFPYGQAVSRVANAALFLAIGTTYGAGDGSTTFNLPDVRGRALFGKDNMGGTPANRITAGVGGLDGVTLGAAAGSEGVTLTEAQMPAHAHKPQRASTGSGGVNEIVSTGTQNLGNLTLQTDTTTKGSSSAHPNIPPAIVVNYIIKT